MLELKFDSDCCFICFRVEVMEARGGQDSGETRYSEGTLSVSEDNQVRIVSEFAAG